MSPVRWVVKTFMYDTWNNKEEKYERRVQKDKPVLQFFNGKCWDDVPTIEIERTR